jgi:hypothetical protein
MPPRVMIYADSETGEIEKIGVADFAVYEGVYGVERDWVEYAPDRFNAGELQAIAAVVALVLDKLQEDDPLT